MSSAAELLGRRQRSYETHKRRILAGLSEARREWERETASRLMVSQKPPFFSYVRDGLSRSRKPAA
jgi:hypothetical protein